MMTKQPFTDLDVVLISNGNLFNLIMGAVKSVLVHSHSQILKDFSKWQKNHTRLGRVIN